MKNVLKLSDNPDSTSKLSFEKREDSAMASTIKKGRKSGYVPESSVVKTLRKIQFKK